MSSWPNLSDRRLGWLSLDLADNDLPRFLIGQGVLAMNWAFIRHYVLKTDDIFLLVGAPTTVMKSG